MANSGVLRLVEGNVYRYNMSGQKTFTYYTKGDATRADFVDNNGNVQLQLKDGKIVFINNGGQVYKIFNWWTKRKNIHFGRSYAYLNESVEWHYSTDVEKMVIRFDAMKENDKRDFLEIVCNKILENGKKWHF